MQKTKLQDSQHFTLKHLASGVYACIHKSGGAAYSNAGIVDLGGRTIVVDAFDTMVAGRDLRQTAEVLFGRPVDRLILTHPHSDHYKGLDEVIDNATVGEPESWPILGLVMPPEADERMTDFWHRYWDRKKGMH